MFETRNIKITKVSKEVIKEYDKDGKLVRERTIINDGGTSQGEAEERLKSAEERLDKMGGKMDNAFKRMDNIFSEMDKMFKDLF